MKKMALDEKLKERGWYLSADGIEECVETLQNVSVDGVIEKALNFDLCDIGSKSLPNEIPKGGRTEFITGPLVLQIQKVRNISAPKANESSATAPKFLRLYLTDGITTINALQHKNWKSISQDTPPGIKIYIRPGRIPLQNGFLFLSDIHFTVLGGNVAALVEKWELARRFASHVHTRGSDAGPPPWVNFGQSINTGALKNLKGNFRSLEQNKKEDKENEAFEQQRQATIAEVTRAKESKKKVFGGGKQMADGDTVQHVGTFHHNEQPQSSLKVNNSNYSSSTSKHESFAADKESRQPASTREDNSNRRKEVTNHQEENVVQTRPSGPSTLFDFLQPQLSLTTGVSDTTKDTSSKGTTQSSNKEHTSNKYNAKSPVHQSSHNNSQNRGNQKVSHDTKNNSRFSNDSSSYRNTPDYRRKPQGGGNNQLRYPAHNESRTYSDRQNNLPDRVRNTNNRNQHRTSKPPRNYSSNQNSISGQETVNNAITDSKLGNSGNGILVDSRQKSDSKPRENKWKTSESQNIYRNPAQKAGNTFEMQENMNGYSSYQQHHPQPPLLTAHSNSSSIGGQQSLKQGDEVLAKYWEDEWQGDLSVHTVNHSLGNSSNTGQQSFTGTLEFRRGGSKPYYHRVTGENSNNRQTADSSSYDRNKPGMSGRPSVQLYQPPARRSADY